MHVHQKSARLLVAATPVAHERDLAPVRQHEAADIERIAEGMLRELRAALIVHAAAGVGAHGIDLRDLLAEARLRRRLHHVGEPGVELGDHGAVERRGRVEGDRAALQRGDFEGPRQAADARPVDLIGESDEIGGLHALLGEAGVFGLVRQAGRCGFCPIEQADSARMATSASKSDRCEARRTMPRA